MATGGEYIYQSLTATLSGDTLYSLTVDVGNDRSSIVGLEFWAGYAVELWAGDTILANDNNTLHPDPSHFLTSSIYYHATSSDPMLGEPLQVHLMSLGGSSKFMAFDKVALEATAVPIPGSISMLLKGLGMFGIMQTRKMHR